MTRRRLLDMDAAAVVGTDACLPPTARWREPAALHRKARVLGYPVNMRGPGPGFFRWRDELSALGIDSVSLNNIGNPFESSAAPFHTHDFERALIIEFARLLDWRPDQAWGFLSHSGTDSNLHGMYIGRTLLRGDTGVLPKAYFTKETHHSVQILRDLLGLDAVLVQTRPDGSMDPDDLDAKLNDHGDAPALVIATLGTTFLGAVDDLDTIGDCLRGRAAYLHVDAALLGGYLPHTQYAAAVARTGFGTQGVEGTPRYDSIAISCHKFFGFPSPAGLFLIGRDRYDAFHEAFQRIHNAGYVGQVPGTISCSRDAVKPAEFYHFVTADSQRGQACAAKAMLELAGELQQEMQQRFPQLSAIRACPLSTTVHFRDPGDAIIEKYSLATLRRPGLGRQAHVVVMPHVDRALLAEFLDDLDRSRAG